VARGLRVEIDEDFFPRDGAADVRHLVARRRRCAPVRGVVLAFHGPDEVPPRAARGVDVVVGNAEVGLQRTGGDLRHDPLPQRGQMGRLLVGVDRLGLEVGEHRRIFEIVQPGIRIGDRH